MVSNQAALLLAIIGGILGHFLFAVLLTQGYYGLILPGGLLGLGAGIVKNTSILVPLSSALLALAAGLLTEYWFFPFIQDGSISYFLMHLTELRPVTLVMIAAGGVIGFWVPSRRRAEK